MKVIDNKSVNFQNDINSPEPVNRLKEPLTVDTLRSFEGLTDLSDSEAEEIVHSIKTLCAFIYDFLCQPKGEEAINEPLNNSIINPLKLAA